MIVNTSQVTAKTILDYYDCNNRLFPQGIDLGNKESQVVGKRYLVVLMNHHISAFHQTSTTILPTYLYSVARFFSKGDVSNLSQKLQPYWKEARSDKWTVEVLEDSVENKEEITHKLGYWTEIVTKAAYVVPKEAVIVRAIHRQTGWAFFYVAAKDDTALITDKQKIALRASVNSTSFFGNHANIRALSDSTFCSHLRTVRNRLRYDLDNKRSEFTTTIVPIYEGMDISAACRKYNKDFRAVWATVHSLETTFIAMGLEKPKVVEKPNPIVYGGVSSPLLAPAAVAPIVEPTEPSAQEEDDEECFDIPGVGVAEQLYNEKRNNVHRDSGTYIAMFAGVNSMDLENLYEILEEMINRSPAFVMALGSKVSAREIANGVVNGIVRDPSNDFVFFEVIVACLKAIEEEITA